MMQFETRTDDGRQGASGREVSGTNAVLTDTKINLFGSQSIPSNARMSNSQTKKSSALISGKGGSQIFNHPVRASRTPHSQKAKSMKQGGGSTSVPASRRGNDNDSLVVSERS